jgi:hypothetical protein
MNNSLGITATGYQTTLYQVLRLHDLDGIGNNERRMSEESRVEETEGCSLFHYKQVCNESPWRKGWALVATRTTQPHN